MVYKIIKTEASILNPDTYLKTVFIDILSVRLKKITNKHVAMCFFFLLTLKKLSSKLDLELYLANLFL